VIVCACVCLCARLFILPVAAMAHSGCALKTGRKSGQSNRLYKRKQASNTFLVCLHCLYFVFSRMVARINM
jgi:hypothetical protein